MPAFRGAWLLGLLTVTLFAGIAALFAGEYGLTLFLIVAPLAPSRGSPRRSAATPTRPTSW